MTAFDQLHPLLQYHIVNTLGWRELRPFQDQVIPPLISGQHAVVLAPTAGGKTEAAVFPAVSRMLGEGWSGTSVLYVCPVKALINNLHHRLQQYLAMVGRRCGVWHGDISSADKKKMLEAMPDLLITTPESLEVLLVSRKADPQLLFAGVRMAIIDEVHALASDDRGWHLLSVLNRISRFAEGPIQRVGLSATVGNADELVQWLAPQNATRASVVGRASATGEADVEIDYVGNLANASTIVARLHRQEKRLVFVDSRARAEKLAAMLREKDVRVWVTHSSLSLDQREAAESAFSGANEGVIVATSVLELGVDVGNLDRVIQIDTPPTVASFLQRMGRTGRREGRARNCLILATDEEALLTASAVTRLWRERFVEDVAFPPRPYHVLVQQIMALMLQQKGLPRDDWRRWLRGTSAFASIDDATIESIFDHNLASGLFSRDGHVLWFGPDGEQKVGARHFMDLLSLVSTPPMYRVRGGSTDLGLVPAEALVRGHEGKTRLLLGGRGWEVQEIDWRRKLVWVTAAGDGGSTRWLGAPRPLHQELCRAALAVLVHEDLQPEWSRRARERIANLRGRFYCMKQGRATLVCGSPERTRLWTFAGMKVNLTIAAALSDRGATDRIDNFGIDLAPEVPVSEWSLRLQNLAMADKPSIDRTQLEDLCKFREFLPDDLLREMYASRIYDMSFAGTCRPVETVVLSPEAARQVNLLR